VTLPEVRLLERGRHYRQLIERTRGCIPIRMAVVHPVDTLSLLGALEAAKAVTMARELKVDALMKGSLQADELMYFVDTPQGLRTERRISHVSAVDVPSFPRPLFITDTAINMYPTLEQKRDIVQNAIDLAHALGIPEPKVAILCAQERVSPKLTSTLDAAVL